MYLNVDLKNIRIHNIKNKFSS